MYVDATFACVPNPFYQLLIVMVFDVSLKIYIPIMYILMSGKTEECYYQAFTYIRGEVPDCDPYCVGVDFEPAFFNAVDLFFPSANLVGCIFHFKQAAKRKMKEFGIPSNEIQVAMQPGVYDLLTNLPPDELDLKGIPYVQCMIIRLIDESYATYSEKTNAGEWEQRCERFWKYFRS